MAADAGYGDTHSGKSKAIERLAGHIFEHSGKRTRVYIGDGGGETYNDRGLVDEGVIELFDFSPLDYPQTVLKLMAELYWPKDWREPKSKLVAPPANLYETYGLVVVEGGTVIGNWMLSDIPGGLAWHGATGTGFGGVKDEDEVLSYRDDFKGFEGQNKDDFLLQGATSPKHFMLAQRKILTAIRKTKQFPGLVFWTFHPTEGPDKTAGGESGKFGELKGKKLIGPDAGGKALVSSLGREFGNMLHFDQLTLLKPGEKDPTTQKPTRVIEKEFRVYTRRHLDPDGQVMIEYEAGTRMSGVKDYYISQTPGDSLLQFYQSVAELRKQHKQQGDTK